MSACSNPEPVKMALNSLEAPTVILCLAGVSGHVLHIMGDSVFCMYRTVTPYKYLCDMTKTKLKMFEKILVLATMKK
jgi:hypothetical protein